MDPTIIISRLQDNGLVIDNMLTGIPVKQERWKPAADKWSMLEVICHLCDEEKDDFRTRLDYTLHKPGQSWPPIDPTGWVFTRHYLDQNFGEMKINFLSARLDTISWLEALNHVDWNMEYSHPQYGIFTAGDLLVSWLAHDYRHIRQLANLNVHYMQVLAAPYSIRYAGD
ncbi:MAG TPA: DinB family protein [bacterium]|nr:DinB family protein [bacterium]HPN43340.1 DinB family protein [bacterium]